MTKASHVDGVLQGCPREVYLELTKYSFSEAEACFHGTVSALSFVNANVSSDWLLKSQSTSMK